ncbi:MAG: hypothetical protein EBZ77_16035, partial [Chitinophagia bacterium]|nr:hypothetical protein [Chitinophagia bacterium]
MMMKRLFYTNILLLAFTAAAVAQTCAKRSFTSGFAAKTTLASLAEDQYDVKYLRFNLNMSDTSVYISGNVSTTAQVVSATMPAYVFELDTTLTIDSAFFNGAPYTVTHT